jgi:hypothetical protein
MAWDTTDLKNFNDIIVQDGVFAYNFTASGAISKGQAVALCPGMNNNVMACDSEAIYANSIGLATMNATKGKWVAVAGPGNICYACTAAATAVGLPLYGTTAGILTAAAGNATKVAAYVVEIPVVKTTNFVGKVLVV